MKKSELKELYQMMFPDYPDIVTVKQLREMLGVSRALAYKLKLEALKHQGQRKDLTSVQVEQKLGAREKVAQEAGESSGVQVMRYIRLTELIQPLLDMVDERKVAFNPAYELSFLTKDEQTRWLKNVTTLNQIMCKRFNSGNQITINTIQMRAVFRI